MKAKTAIRLRPVFWSIIIFILAQGLTFLVVPHEDVFLAKNNLSLPIQSAEAISAPNSAPTKRTIQEARNKGMLVDMTNGRRTKAVVFIDSGHIVLAALAPETITGRLQITRGSAVVRPELSDEALTP